MSVTRALLAVLLGCSLLRPVAAQETGAPAMESLGDDRYRVGNVVLDAAAGQITMPARVNMQEGLIEVFACTPQGKLHESTLVVDVDPLHVQLALLTLDLEYGRVLEHQGEARRPEGDPVRVWVEWGDGDARQRWRAEDLIWNGPAERTMEHVEWVFAGSKVINGTFMATVEGQLITTYRDPFTVLDNPLDAGADDTVYFSYPDRLPPEGTPVTLILEDARGE